MSSRWRLTADKTETRPTTNEEVRYFANYWEAKIARGRRSENCGKGTITKRSFEVTFNGRKDGGKSFFITLEKRDINEEGGKIKLPKCLIYFGKDEKSAKSVVHLNDNTDIEDINDVLYQCSASKLSKRLDKDIQVAQNKLAKIERNQLKWSINQNLANLYYSFKLKTAEELRKELPKKEGAEHFACFIRKFIVTTPEQRDAYADYEMNKEAALKEKYKDAKGRSMAQKRQIRKNLVESAKEAAKEAKILREIFGRSYR